MGWEAWFTLGVIGVILGTLIFTRIAPDIVLIGGVTLLMLFGVLTTERALAGLSNEGMVTVGVLYIVVAGLRETGGIGFLAQRILGLPKSLQSAQIRLTVPSCVMSAFMNNTPLVAMMLPVVSEWAKKCRFSVSKLLIPLSYATILGGTCTLIGTSTNLVVNGMLQKQPGWERGLGMFTVTWIGVPCAILGLIYLIFFSRRLLPERKPVISVQDDPREYTVEMMVEPGGPVAGKSIEEAGLRHLPGMYLIEIEREGRVLAAVGPQERLAGGDRLVFAGIVESIVDLQKIRGLLPATNQVFKLDAPRSKRGLIEAVVSNTCKIVGQTIRDAKFRTTYGAAVIAVGRNGERIRKKIGDIIVEAGDTLLLEAPPSFVEQHRNSRDFYLVSQVEDSTPPRHDRAIVAVAILGGMVVAAGTNLLPMMHAAMLAAGLMIITRCCTTTVARRSVDWQVLTIIAASMGLGYAVEDSGLAQVVAADIIAMAGSHPWLLIFVVYGVTMVLTELITNNAAAALVFPIAFTASQRLGIDFTPFAVTIMMAASASFSTPIGYATNLMVYGPGGYRFTDYFRVGIPLNVAMWLTTSLLVPLLWNVEATGGGATPS
ncbi:MAG: anion permease [Phycisphaerae bacterium]|nr:MAG: SLC13 family permease [Planctomycetota bacterium]KAB2942163.1 MAG: SLC13 family permease [Phycisphaerae bacterium]MBE7458044.1 SLC13 family permease [Planctomycetia bacterium]MCK6464492.1 SLC13 family permease [Phycisphaerae bacterium]MCL4717958.1 anion permease [Phycisphaerae bacterium]